MRLPLRLTLALAGLSLLSGCLSGFSRPEGVMPTGDVAPPPALRGTAAGRSLAAAPAETAPMPAPRASRELSVPRTANGGNTLTKPSERKFRREDLEDDGSGGGSGGMGSSVAPTISPSGSVGVGGRF